MFQLGPRQGRIQSPPFTHLLFCLVHPATFPFSFITMRIERTPFVILSPHLTSQEDVTTDNAAPYLPTGHKTSKIERVLQVKLHETLNMVILEKRALNIIRPGNINATLVRENSSPLRPDIKADLCVRVMTSAFSKIPLLPLSPQRWRHPSQSERRDVLSFQSQEICMGMEKGERKLLIYFLRE